MKIFDFASDDDDDGGASRFLFLIIFSRKGRWRSNTKILDENNYTEYAADGRCCNDNYFSHENKPKRNYSL